MLKNLKRNLKNIFFISILFTAGINAQIIFLPFENESSYQGAWNISVEIPNYLAAYSRELYEINVLSSSAAIKLALDRGFNVKDIPDFEAIQFIANEYNFRYALFGKINKFIISRFLAGEPTLAGYEAYSCLIDATIRIFDIEKNEFIYAENIIEEVNDRGFGLTLLGKPSKEKEQFYGLDAMRFGGEEFNKTIVGLTLFNFAEKLSNDINRFNKSILKDEKTVVIKKIPADEALDDFKLNTEVKKGIILTFDKSTGEAFINLGSFDDMKVGEEIGVYALADSLFDPVTNEFLGVSDKKISEMEIIEVRGERFSLAVVKRNRELVEQGMEVRKLTIRLRE